MKGSTVSEIEVEPAQVQSLLAAMNQLTLQAGDLERYAADHVFDASGFIGALEPLAEVMPTLAGYFSDLTDYFEDRWIQVGEATEEATGVIYRQDSSTGEKFRRGEAIL